MNTATVRERLKMDRLTKLSVTVAVALMLHLLPVASADPLSPPAAAPAAPEPPSVSTPATPAPSSLPAAPSSVPAPPPEPKILDNSDAASYLRNITGGKKALVLDCGEDYNDDLCDTHFDFFEDRFSKSAGNVLFDVPEDLKATGFTLPVCDASNRCWGALVKPKQIWKGQVQGFFPDFDEEYDDTDGYGAVQSKANLWAICPGCEMAFAKVPVKGDLEGVPLSESENGPFLLAFNPPVTRVDGLSLPPFEFPGRMNMLSGTQQLRTEVPEGGYVILRHRGPDKYRYFMVRDRQSGEIKMSPPSLTLIDRED